ncbi:DUF305 domain-containing protein [Geodermatophilus sp. SYSU D00697]
MTSRAWRIAAGAALVLALGGIGTSVAVADPDRHAPRAGASSGPAGLVDLHFATAMVPHHEDAVAMAELAPGRSRDAELLALAERIARSQSEEIVLLQDAADRLAAEDVGRSGMGGMGMGGMGMGGMGMGGMGMGGMGGGGMGTGGEDVPRMGMGGMSRAGMAGDTDLSALSGDAFDRAFLEQMVAHHRVGVHMAEMEVRAGSDPEVRELAGTMVEVQSSEIALMQGWLQDRFGA